MQISLFRGSRTVMSLRLCSRAPWTTSSSEAITDPVYRGDRIEQVFVRRPANPLPKRSFVGKTVAARVPRPLAGALAETGPDGVQQDVLARLCEVLLALDDAGAVAGPEEMTLTCVTPVEVLRIDPVEPLHSRRESGTRAVAGYVVVRGHAAERGEV